MPNTPHQTHAHSIWLPFLIAAILWTIVAFSSCTTQYGCSSVKGTSGYVPYKK